MIALAVVVLSIDPEDVERRIAALRASPAGRRIDCHAAVPTGGGGLGAAANAAARESASDAIAFLRASFEPRGEWIDAVLEAIAAPDAPLAIPRILDRTGARISSASAGTRDGRLAGMLAGAVATHPMALVPRNVDLAASGAVVMRRSTFDELGGFDPCYRESFLETDIALRARVRGGRVVYRPDFVLRDTCYAAATPMLDDARAFLERWSAVFTPPLALERLAS